MKAVRIKSCPAWVAGVLAVGVVLLQATVSLAQTGFINEVDPNGAGTDTNDFVEIIAPAGTDVTGWRLVHVNGSGGADPFDFTIPAFTIPDDGITSTNAIALGFLVLGQSTDSVVNADIALPVSLQAGPDGLILYDAASNILDAVAYGGFGDLLTQFAGILTTNGSPAAGNYLHDLPTAGSNDDALQAPDDVVGDSGAGWADLPRTPGAINASQISGQISITPPTDLPPSVTVPGTQNVLESNTLSFVVSVSEIDGDAVTLTASNVPANASFTATNGLGTASGQLIFTPDNSQAGMTFPVSFYAMDKDGSDTGTVDVIVIPLGSGVAIPDDFEDGDLSGWTQGSFGDWVNSSNAPITGTRSLKHNLSGVSANSTITAEPPAYSLASTQTVWQFNVKNGNWDPSTGNRFHVFLTANESDIGGNTVDGYAVGVNLTGSSDFLTLWRVTNGAADGALVTSAFDWNASQTVGVQVVRSPAGRWELLFDGDGGFDNLVSAGAATDTTYTDTTYFGLYFEFTSTRAGLLWFDDVDIFQTVPSVDVPPSVVVPGPQVVKANDTLTFDVTASEPDGDLITMSTGTLPANANFTPSNGVMAASGTLEFTPDPSQVGAAISIDFLATDKDGTGSNTVSITVTPAGTGLDLIVSEIMQDPAGVADGDGEYFELFNRTMSDIDINGWTIKDDGANLHVINNGGPLLVPAGGFLVLGRSTNLLTNGGTPVDYQYGSSYTLGNTSDQVILVNTSGTEQVRVGYDDGATFPDPTGASMELVSPDVDITLGSNWVEATSTWVGNTSGDFGSPGDANEMGDWGGGMMPEDLDGDGIADDWEIMFFGSTNETASGDWDMDGSDNFNEYVADTNPTNPASFFSISVFTGEVSRAIVYDPTSTERVYTPQYTTNINEEMDWTDLEATAPGNGAGKTAIDSSGDIYRNYRVDVAIP